MWDWLRTKGRALLGLLADLGGALAFLSIAATLLSVALIGTILAAIDIFPEPYFTLLVIAVGSLTAGLALVFIPRLLPEPVPATSATSASATELKAEQAARDAEAAAQLKRETSERERAERERDKAMRLRRGTRRIREELLDNDRAVMRVPSRLDELLELNFGVWDADRSVLLDADDPEPHERASHAYRQIRGLLSGRIGEDDFGGGPHTYGQPPTDEEVVAVRRGISKAVEVLR
jgi:hypothetical protein